MSIKRVFSAFVRVLAWALPALVVLGFGEAWWFTLGLLSAFRLDLAVIAGGVLLIALPFRAWRVALPAGAALVLAATTPGPVWGVPARPPPGAGQSVSLLFANVRFSNEVPDAMQEALLAHDADVVVVVEAPRAIIGGALDRRYPHRVLRQGKPSLNPAMAMWSRHPLEDGAVNLSRRIAPGAVGATVRLGGDTRFGLLGLHFHRPGLLRGGSVRLGNQLEGVPGLVDRLEPPLVVVGDFNAAPWSRVVAETAALTGTVPAPGYRITWRGEYPGLGLPAVVGRAIDHLLVAPGVGIASLETVEIPGSDHRGLLAELIVPAPDGGTEAHLSPTAATDYVSPATR